MKISFILFFLISVVANFGTKQDNTTEKEPVQNNYTTISMVDEYTADININKTQDGSIVVLISGNPAMQNQFYLLQTNNTYQVNESRNGVVVSDRGTYLLIKDTNEREYYVLSVNGDEPPVGEVSTYTAISKFDGFGLVSNVNPTLYSLINTAATTFPSNPWPDISGLVSCHCETGTPSGCTSGGIGSSSCTISNSEGESCSVSCAGGFYACCM